jgi:hypothetical protein
MKFSQINKRKMLMISRWVLENHNFKTCILVPRQPGNAPKESIQMMNMKPCHVKIKEPSPLEKILLKDGPETPEQDNLFGRM